MARGRWLLIIGLTLLVGGLAWSVLRVTLMSATDRGNASGYGQFVLAAAGLLLTIWQLFGGRLRPQPAAPLGLEELADRLAVAVRTQWSAAAMDRGLLERAPLPIRWRRCADPVAGPVSAATAPRGDGASFAPLPGVDRVGPAQLREGTHRTLHRIYGGLASGRLILTGGPGTGKSSAAILLLLDALRYRDHMAADDRAKVPVPVLFTLHGWNPDTISVHEWLAVKLTELPTLDGRQGHQHASELLAAGRLSVFLDGLDEIPEPQRPTALQALSRQATFRLVLLTRTKELAEAAQHHILTGAVAVELQPLTPNDAAAYLRNGLPDLLPAPWSRFLATLTADTGAPVANALNNPLTVTLLRDVYLPTQNSAVGSVDKLLDTARFPGPEHITNHLLDHAITTAYSPRPGQPVPRYPEHVAHRTLTLVAQYLRDHKTRDLAWWDMSNWVPGVPRALVTALLDAITFGVVFGLAIGLVTKVATGSIVGLPFGGIGGLVLGLFVGLWVGSSESEKPSRLDRFRWSRVPRRPVLAFVLLVGLVSGLAFSLATGPAVGLVAGPAFGLATGLILVSAFGFESSDPSNVAHPSDLWRGDIAFRLTITLSFGLSVGFVMGLVFGLGKGLWFGLAGGLAYGLSAGITLTEAWRTMISQIYLAIRYRTPIRLTRFLRDAHARHLLRTVGPIYQFRHATLQDRLAPPVD
jgi:hypothetical protein